MKKFCTALGSVVFFVGLVLFGCTSFSPDAGTPSEQTGKSEHPYFSVSLECSEVKPRAVIARLSWSSVKAVSADQRIEATVHKNGFKNKRYISLPIGNEASKYRSETKYQQAQPQALELKVETVKHLKDKRRNEVVVSGLVPGVNYFWRIIPPPEGMDKSIVVRSRAPICPADMVDSKEEERK